MFRPTLLIVAVSLLVPSAASAQRWKGKSNWGRGRGANIQRYTGGSRTFSEPSLLGFGIGIGSYPRYGYPHPYGFDPYRFDSYLYDPYRTGSFEPPDLLNDPYFRERHRYDSHFPGPSSRDPYLVPRRPLESVYAPAPIPVTEAPVATTRSVPIDTQSSDLEAALRIATQQLTRSLFQRYGNDWVEYLASHRISRLVAESNTVRIQQLLTHYDGVIANPELQVVTTLPGFFETRELMIRFVREQAAVDQSPAELGTSVEEVPLPKRIAKPKDSAADGS